MGESGHHGATPDTALSPRSARKRRDVLAAARAVFARVGYVRAGIEMIAAEAGVSTRTIYNHFDGKERLFATVLLDSAAEVARLREDAVARHLADAVDPAAALVAFGTDWLRQSREQAEHFALVRRVNAEAEAFPAELLAAWQEAGPMRVQQALAAALAGLAARGLLRVDDPDIAARHFSALVTAGTSGPAGRRAATLGDEEARGQAEVAVRAFLHGYGG